MKTPGLMRKVLWSSGADPATVLGRLWRLGYTDRIRLTAELVAESLGFSLEVLEEAGGGYRFRTYVLTTTDEDGMTWKSPLGTTLPDVERTMRKQFGAVRWSDAYDQVNAFIETTRSGRRRQTAPLRTTRPRKKRL